MTREEIIKGLYCGYSCTEKDECFESGCRDCLDKMFNEYEQKIRVDAIEKLFNAEIINGMTLKEIYEYAPSGKFDEGWNCCYENFCEVMEHLWQIPID